MKHFLTIILISIPFFSTYLFSQQPEMKELWSKRTEHERYWFIEKSKTSDNIFLLMALKPSSSKNIIEEWNPNTNQLVQSYEINKPIAYLTHDPSGKYLVCTYYLHRNAVILDLTTGIIKEHILPDGGPYTGYLKPVFLPGGQFYATYEYNSKKLYRVNINNALIEKAYDLSGIASSVYYSRDANYFAYYTEDKKLIVRYLPSGAETASFEMPDKPYAMDFVNLNNLVVSFHYNDKPSKVVSYDAFTGNENYSFEFNLKYNNVAASADLNWIFLCSQENFRLYTYNTKDETITGFNSLFEPSLLNSDVKHNLAYLIDRNGNLNIASAELGMIVRTKELSDPTKHKFINQIKFTPNQKYLVTTGIHGDIIFHHPLTGNYISHIKLELDTIASLDISDDSKRIIVSDRSGKTKIVNIEDIQQPIIELNYFHQGTFLTRFWDESSFFVSGAGTGLWFMHEGGIKNIMPKDKYFTSVDLAFSPDKEKMALATGELKIVMFKRNPGSGYFEYETEFWADSSLNFKTINSVRFSKDGRYIISSTNMHKSRLWDAETYELIRSYESKEGTKDKSITSSILSNDNELIFHCDAIPTLRVFHRPNGYILDEKLNLMPEPFVKWSSMDLSSDGNLLAIVSGNGSFFMFDVYGTTSVGVPYPANTNYFVFPNPSNDFINLRISDKDFDNYQLNLKAITITNLMGETVMTTTLANQTEYRIDISQLPDGIYFIHLGNETMNFVKY